MNDTDRKILWLALDHRTPEAEAIAAFAAMRRRRFTYADVNKFSRSKPVEPTAKPPPEPKPPPKTEAKSPPKTEPKTPPKAKHEPPKPVPETDDGWTFIWAGIAVLILMFLPFMLSMRSAAKINHIPNGIDLDAIGRAAGPLRQAGPVAISNQFPTLEAAFRQANLEYPP